MAVLATRLIKLTFLPASSTSSCLRFIPGEFLKKIVYFNDYVLKIMNILRYIDAFYDKNLYQ